MRQRRSSNGVVVNAIAGTHVVTLGLDLSGAARARSLGFCHPARGPQLHIAEP
jgi:hypothetical protein